MVKNLKFQIIGTLFFLFFAGFSYLVSRDVFDQIDFDTTVKLQDRIADRVVDVFSIFSLLGTVEIASIILLIGLFLGFKLKKIFVLFFYALTGVIELLGKVVIEHTSPPILFLKTHTLLQFPSSYIPHEFYSYPSGHSARTAFVSSVLLFALWNSKLTRGLKIAFAFCILIFDLVMFVSRVYLGEHWSTDVIGGALLGFSLAGLAFYFIKPAKRQA